MIELRTLGALGLSHPDGTAIRSVLVQPKRFALLAFLAMAEPRVFLRRSSLLPLFWPETGEIAARHSLSQSLYKLRQAIGSTAIEVRGEEEVRLSPGALGCDAVTFEGHVKEGRWAEAVELYRGDYLPGLEFSEMGEFERWLDAERNRLRSAAAHAAWSLAGEQLARGAATDAERTASKALDLDPVNEERARTFIRDLAAAGAASAAFGFYEKLTSTLAAEFDVEPAAETTELIRLLRESRSRRNEPPATEMEGALLPTVASIDVPVGGAVGAPVSPPVMVDAVSPRESSRPTSAFPALPVRAWRIVAAGAALATALLVVFVIARPSVDVEARRIVVVPFENRTGDISLEPLGTIAADWIVHGLSWTDVVNVVPGVHVSGLLRELEDERNSHSTEGRTRILAQALGAGTVVAGSYHLRDGNLEFAAQVIDIGNGRILRAVDGVRGPRNNAMVAIDELRRRTMSAVGFQFDARIYPAVQSAMQPPSYEAYQAFAAGMDHHNRTQWRQALPYFNKAFALDSSFTGALFLAAIDHLNLGELAQADSLVRIFARSRERLPPLERQFLEWIEAELRGDLQGALEAARGLIPFSDAFRNQLAHNALRANRPREAIEAYKGFNIDLRSELKWRLNYGWRLTDAYHRLGMHRRELAEAQRGRKRNPNLLEPVLWELRALAALGRVLPVQERLEEALASPPNAFWTPGVIMLRAADELHAHGHDHAARAILLRALEWHRTLPDSQQLLLRNRRYRATTLLRADSLEAAEVAFRALAAEFPDDPYYVASVAVALARRGDRAAASLIANTVLNRDPPRDFGHHVYERARVAAQLGNTDEAVALLRLAFANGFDFAFVGGVGAGAPRPDGSPHLDPAFDGVRAHRGYQELARGPK